MKNYILFLIFITVSFTINAQTTWTGLGADTNWNNTDNWDTNLVPTIADDVIIPTGFTVTLNVAGTMKSIDVQGTSVFDMNFNLTFTEPSTFGSNTTINWAGGTLNGTSSTLANQGTINITTTGNHFINGGTTLDNQGTVNLTESGDLYVNQDSMLNNPTGGVIDMQADTGNIQFNLSPAGVLANEGVIKKTTSSGEAQIIIPINNNDGTIQVEVGTLSFQGTGKNFIDGTYNVFAGATMDWDTTINPSGTIEGTIVGDLNWNNILNVPTGETVFLNFLETDNFNWIGTLSGGGTLTNTNVLNFAGTGNSFINGGTTLDNLGTINFTGTKDLYINQSSVLNNPIGSVIDMQADTGNIQFNLSPAGVLVNEGVIKKTTSSGEAQIIIPINNNDGTIQVEVGTLSFQGTGKNFTDGTFNVFAGATMDWDTTINPSGTLEGTIVGDLNWNTTVNVVDGTFAAINFSETDNFNWKGTLSGGGTLTNTNVLNFADAGNSFINGGTTLDNQGTINFTGTKDLYINQDSVLNNLSDGVIDMQADTGNIQFNLSPSGVFNNAGLIKRTTTTGIAQILVELNNSGTIEVVSGELEYTGSNAFTNEVTGIVKGIGVFDLPTVANYTNNGTFAPGLSPGTLSVQGDYKSSSTSVLDVELDGLTPETEYDVLAITGTNNVFEGTVNVTMGFDGTIGDTFTVATTTGIIVTQNLISPIENVDLDGKRYTLDVSYPGDNSVMLTITGKLDIQVPDVIAQNITVQLDASGNASITTAQIDNGSTDNCTTVPNLLYGLDITAFTCTQLGNNTVVLTVTDEEGLSANANAIVTVEDNVLPTVVTQNITVQLDASGNAAITTGDIDDGSSDNCTVSSMSLDVTTFTCADLGDNTVNLTVTDQSTNNASAPAIVTVEDDIAPVIACPADFMIDSEGSFTLLNYYDLGNVTATDNCSVDTVLQSPAAGTVLEDGDHVISYTVTDTTGNTHDCSFTLNVNDTTLSIDDYNLSDIDVVAFPNPTYKNITLDFEKIIGEIDVTISNILGQVITNERFVNTSTIDLSINGSPGIYFVNLTTSEGSKKTLKIIKQ